MVQYSPDSLSKLKEVICPLCVKKLDDWDDDVYKCWLRYINGEDRNKIIENTRFSLYVSPRYYFRKHPCYRKISIIRKQLFRRIKTQVKDSIVKYPWLLGIYFADGFLRTRRTQLAFVLTSHEVLIVNRIDHQLKNLLKGNIHIAKDYIGNMIQIRLHSKELCKLFPDKKSESEFKSLWNSFDEKSKMEFVAGFVDGDGACQFDVGINSITLYSKVVPFILSPMKEFLSQYGYVSAQENKLYLSPTVGKLVKPLTVKKYISKPYEGSIDVKKALRFLESGLSVREISRRLGKDRKTITLALKKVYGTENVQKYFDHHNTKL